MSSVLGLIIIINNPLNRLRRFIVLVGNKAASLNEHIISESEAADFVE
jgi:hypothetical protein